MTSKSAMHPLRLSALSVALASSLCAAPALAELKLGALMPLTGGLQAYGESCLNGVKLAVEEINGAGGIGGEAVSLIVGDTQTKSQPAIDAAKRMVSVEGVTAIVGALSSGNTIPVAQSVGSVDKVPMVSPASTAPTITDLEDGDYLFRTVPSDAFQGVALGQLVSDAGIQKVAVIYVNNDYGDGLAKAFIDTFTRSGGEITGQAAFEPNKESYRGELASLGDADALLVIAYPDDGGISIVRQSLEEGFYDKFVFTDGMKVEKVVETIGAQYLSGAFGTSSKSLESDASTAFQSLYEASFGELPPRPYIDTSYDAAMLLMLAHAKAGSTEGMAIRDALRDVANEPGIEIKPGEAAKALEALKNGEDINYVGASGDVELDANGDVSGTFEHWVVADDGTLETVTVFEPVMAE